MALLRTEVLNFLNQIAAVDQYKMKELQIFPIKDFTELADMMCWKSCKYIY